MHPQQRRDLAHLRQLVQRGLPMHYYVELEHLILSGEFTFSDTRAVILHGMARAVYVLWWMNERQWLNDNKGTALPWNGSRKAPEEHAPKSTPASARKWAEDVLTEYEQKTGVPAELLYWLAERAPGTHEQPPTPEGFGHALAMEAHVGSISADRWFNSHPPFEPLARVAGQIEADYWG